MSARPSLLLITCFCHSINYVMSLLKLLIIVVSLSFFMSSTQYAKGHHHLTMSSEICQSSRVFSCPPTYPWYDFQHGFVTPVTWLETWTRWKIVDTLVYLLQVCSNSTKGYIFTLIALEYYLYPHKKVSTHRCCIKTMEKSFNIYLLLGSFNVL